MLCPYCSEEIKDGAKKCKHCGEFLDESLKEEKTKVVEKVVESKTVKDYSFYSEIKYQARQKINCPACGFSGIASSERRYSGFVFLILLLLGFIPGIIYYLCCPKVCKCPKCGNNKLSNDGKESFMEEGKRQLKTGCLRFLGIILFVFIVGLLTDDGTGSSSTNRKKTTTTTTTTKKTYTDLNEAYNAHKRYIRNVTQEGVKLISTNQAHKFEGPTYAGTPDGKNFLVQGTDNGREFACVFEKEDNERGMKIVNCAWVQ